MLQALPQFPGDTGPRLPAASRPSWAVPGSPHRVAASWEPWRMSSPRAGPGPKPQPPRALRLAVATALPRLPPLTEQFRSPWFKAGPVARADACARLRKIPHPMLWRSQPSGAFFFFFLPRNMSQYGNPVLTSLWNRGTSTTQGMTPDTTLTIGLSPLSLRDSPDSSLWRDRYASKSPPPPFTPAPDFSPWS